MGDKTCETYKKDECLRGIAFVTRKDRINNNDVVCSRTGKMENEEVR